MTETETKDNLIKTFLAGLWNLLYGFLTGKNTIKAVCLGIIPLYTMFAGGMATADPANALYWTLSVFAVTGLLTYLGDFLTAYFQGAGFYATIKELLARLGIRFDTPVPVSVATEIIFNGVKYLHKATDPAGVFFNEAKKFVYIVKRGHNLKKLAFRYLPTDYYIVFTSDGEESDCKYADGTLYTDVEDPLEENESKLEVMQQLLQLKGSEALEYIIKELGERGVDTAVLKMSLLEPAHYVAQIAQMKEDGTWQSFVDGTWANGDGIPYRWSNYLSKTDADKLTEHALALFEGYFA